MSATNKIDKYNLSDRILALSGQGKPSAEIAEIVTRELEGMDSISQPSVSRFLKKVRGQRKEAADYVVDEFIRTELPGDLKILSDMKQDYLTFRNSVIEYITGQVDGKIGPDGAISHDLKTLILLDDKLHDLVKTTLRFVGVDGGEDGDKRRHPVDLSQYRKDLDALKEKGAVNG